MVIKKTPSSLLSLLESHAGWPPLKALVPPKPQTLITLRSSPVKPTEKKRKREKRPGKEVVEEGEIYNHPPSNPAKAAKVACFK